MFSGLADVESVSVLNCTENEITVEWNKVYNINNYVLVFDGIHSYISGFENVSVVTHTASSLHPGRVHSFILHTVSNREMSDGYHFYAVTGEAISILFSCYNMHRGIVVLIHAFC